MPVSNLPRPPKKGSLDKWAEALVSALDIALTELAQERNPETTHTARRLTAASGTPLALSNAVISAGWGTGGTTPTAIAGNDQRGSVSVLAAGVPTPNPTVTLTFSGGAWRVAPFAAACRGDANLPLGALTAAATTTTLTLTFHGTPVAGSTYVLNWVLLG